VTGAVIVEADGGSRGNPGPAGYGAVVFDATDHRVLAERKESIGIATNNVAEYRGLIAGLQAAKELGATSVAVRMDSKLVVEQMSGRWQVKNETLRPLVRQASDLRSALGPVTFEWMPRERNKHADRLANEAMDEAAGRAPRAGSKPQTAVAPKPPVAAWSPPPGEPTRLILVRHGSTMHSPERRFSGRNALALSELGAQQAAALAGRAPSFGSVAAIVSSPLVRARQTADAIADVLGLKVDVNDDLAEMDFGAWEGQSFAEVNQSDPDGLSNWLASPQSAPTGGEPYATLVRRVRRARDTIIAGYPGQTVLVVSHVTPIKAILALALELEPSATFRIHLDPASVSAVSYFSDGTPSIRLVNDTSHLG
jgi:ribonuclease H / adenosylcobalamin/alpha-ribazole phosphatase